MKTIGLLGGMSWESTLVYYRLINQAVQKRLGGLHSAKILLHSVNFAQMAELQKQGEWQEAGNTLGAAAKGLVKAGADGILICTNTMHLVADQVASAAGVPLLHIADATGAAIKSAGLTRVGLLGTAFTMEQGFYKDHLRDKFAIECIVPDDEDRGLVHAVIFDELCCGKISEQSRKAYMQVIEKLIDAGAQGIVLGCTEIALLISAQDISVPVFDTTALHAQAAVDWALA